MTGQTSSWMRKFHNAWLRIFCNFTDPQPKAAGITLNFRNSSVGEIWYWNCKRLGCPYKIEYLKSLNNWCVNVWWMVLVTRTNVLFILVSQDICPLKSKFLHHHWTCSKSIWFSVILALKHNEVHMFLLFLLLLHCIIIIIIINLKIYLCFTHFQHWSQ